MFQAARKRHIANFLRALLAQQRVTRNYEMLIWKTIVRFVNEFQLKSSQLKSSRSSQYLSAQRPSSSRLYRPTSEPKLDSTLVLQTDLIQVFSEKFEVSFYLSFEKIEKEYISRHYEPVNGGSVHLYGLVKRIQSTL